MKNIIKKHKLLFLMISMLVIYVFQFLVIPFCFPQFYPVSNEAFSIFIIPLLVFSVAVNIALDVKILLWTIADVLYGVLVIVYNGNGLYSIGRRGIALDGMSTIYSLELAAITVIVIIIILFAVQILIRAFRLLFMKSKNKKS